MTKRLAIGFVLAAAFLCATPQSNATTDPFVNFDQADNNFVMVAAHRCGYKSNGIVILPENSLAAAQYSVDLGVDILETDIHLTSDNVPILMHDTTVDRTTDGSGAVSSMTLAQIRLLNLTGSSSGETVPTLEELMVLVKGKALVNMDKVDINNINLRDRVMDVLIATDTVDHAIFKGGASVTQVDVMRTAYPGETILYMPILSNSDETQMISMLNSHIPPATELIFGSTPTGMLSENSVATAVSTDTRIWINSLWSSLCAGHTDAVALGGNPDGSWGWLIDNGASIIQTDNAAQLIPYLESLGLRGFPAPLPPLPPVASYDFDDGTLQGWTNTLTGGATVSTLTHFSARTDQGRGGGFSPEFSLLHDGDGTWLDGRDIAHDTLVVSSPEFKIHKAQAISFHLLGGTGNTSAAPSSLAALPATTSTDGFMGVALRRVGDGTYLLHDRRSLSAQYSAWEKQGWSDAEVAAAIANDSTNETYQLDLIDQFHGGWSWIIMDSIAIEDTPFNEWIHQTLGDSAPNRSAIDDFDGDSAANLLEYFSGTHPADPLDTPTLSGVFTHDAPVVFYHRAKNRVDVSGQLQWCTNLFETWQVSGASDGARTITISEVVIDQIDEIEIVEASLQTTTGPVPQALFIRLKVQ